MNAEDNTVLYSQQKRAMLAVGTLHIPFTVYYAAGEQLSESARIWPTTKSRTIIVGWSPVSIVSVQSNERESQQPMFGRQCPSLWFVLDQQFLDNPIPERVKPRATVMHFKLTHQITLTALQNGETIKTNGLCYWLQSMMDKSDHDVWTADR